MSAAALPRDPVVLELLLRQATQLLEAVEPIVAKFRVQDRMLAELVHDPSEWVVRRSHFYRHLRDAIDRDIASLGPPFSALLPYLDIDSAHGALFREPLANLALDPGSSAGVSEMLHSVSAKHEAIDNATSLVRQLQTAIIAKLNEQPKLSSGHVPHEAGAGDSEEGLDSSGVTSPERGKRPSRLFPKLDDLRWEEVLITFVSDDAVRITARGQNLRMHYVEMGFADRRKTDMPDSRWVILREMACNAGLIDWESRWVRPKDRNKMSSAISSISKRLIEILQISEQPFEPYKKHKRYKPKFALRAESSVNSSREADTEDD